ncbi:hypothetical protein I4F81_001559 [Pyropia yezoensis]|uniref:Uncharacterized protein n=1 Tax=Pyropia yezoensis TaxID=2788 RepID=A0ACC3BLW8_PYRYE|nr:hypothetical protein I4F81_001559 [Neopyropia yezoensis]
MISVCADPECPGAEDRFLLVDGAHRLTALRELHKEGHANAVGEVQVAVIVRRDGQPVTLMMALTLGVRANSTAAKAKEMSDVDNIRFITSWLREYNDRQPLRKKQSLFQHSMSDLIRIFYNYMDNRKQDPMDVDLAYRESDEVDREQEDQDDATVRGGPETSRIGKAVLRRMIKIALIYIEDKRSREYIIKRITDSVGSRGEHAMTTESCASPALCTLGGVPLVYCNEVRLWMLQVGWEWTGRRDADNNAIRPLTRGTDSALFATLVYFVRFAINEAKLRRTLLRMASAKGRAIAEAQALTAECAVFTHRAPLTDVLKQERRRQNLSLLDEL